MAPEDQERQENNNPKYSHMIKVVTAARVSNRPYLVPPVIMAAAVAAASTTSGTGSATLATEDWAEVLQEGRCMVLRVLRVQPSQGVEVAAVYICLRGVQAAPASSSSATRRKPPARRRARRASTSRMERAWRVRRGRPARAVTRQSAPHRRRHHPQGHRHRHRNHRRHPHRLRRKRRRQRRRPATRSSPTSRTLR